MTPFNWREWQIVLKLDPDKKINQHYLKEILSGKIDAVLVGGTQNITADNTYNLIDQIKQTGYNGPLIQEISEINAIAYMVDGYAIPVVLNAGDKEYITGAHYTAVKKMGNLIDWERVLPFGYIVCNPDSAVARLTGTRNVTIEDAVAYATMAEKLFRFPVIYIEYSGRYGDKNLVEAVAKMPRNARIFYGGGIHSVAQAKEMLELADTIIIGNALYDNPEILNEIRKSLPIG